MLPTKLILSAFISYPLKTTIDFTLLGEKSTYLITGDTGAGKSSIFDAICFALYGKSSGDKARGKLRSIYANPDDDTYVELYFKHKNKDYYVQRTLDFAKKDYTASPTSKFTFSETDADGKQHILNSNSKKAGNKVTIEDIIGLDYNQFKQVCMIAQGDFFNLIKAKSDERKAIFTKVFNTYLYSELNGIVVEEKKNAENKINASTKELFTFIGGVDENDAHSGEKAALLEECDEKLPPSKVEEIQTLLNTVISEDTEEKTRIEEERAVSDKLIEEQTRLIEKAESNANIRRQLEEKKNELKMLSEEKEQAEDSLQKARANESKITSNENEAALIEHTLPKYKKLADSRASQSQLESYLDNKNALLNSISVYIENLTRDRAEYEKKLEKLTDIDTRFANAKAELETAEKDARKADELLETRAVVSQKDAIYRTAVKKFVSLESKAFDERREYLLEAFASVHACEAALAQTEERIKVCEKKINETNIALSSLSDAEKELAHAENRIKELNARIDDIARFEKAVETLSKTRELKFRSYEKYISADNDASTAKKRFDELQKTLNANDYWRIALTLKENEPCPVCGCKTHPKIAEKPLTAPTKSEVDSAKAEYDHLVLLANDRYSEHSRIEGQLNTQLENVSNDGKRIIGETFGADNAAQQIADEKKRLSELSSNAQKALDNAKGNVELKEEKSRLLSELTSEEKKLERELSTLSSELVKKKADSENIEGALKAAAGNVAQRLSSIGLSSRSDTIDVHIPLDNDPETRAADFELSAQSKRCEKACNDADKMLANAVKAYRDFTDAKLTFNERFRSFCGEDISDMQNEDMESSLLNKTNAAKDKLASAQSAYTSAKAELDERDTLRERLETVGKNISDSVSRVSRIENDITRSETELESCKKDITSLGEELSFDSEDDAAARISALRKESKALRETIENSRKALDEITKALSHTSGNITELEKRIDVSVPAQTDTETEKQKLREMKEKRKSSADILITLGTRLRNNTRTAKLIKETEERRMKEQEEFGVIGILSEVITGNIPGKPKLSFETFVQLHYFDMVIKSANERLAILSDGKYLLTRKARKGDLRSNVGLDLDIIDLDCKDPKARVRDVFGISGGEKFIVALSLAFGLSDEILHRAGALSFDTLFLDEGFDSLGSKHLQLTIDMLKKMPESDNRLIGIISHVESMSYDIPRRMLVTNNGSSGSVVKIINEEG